MLFWHLKIKSFLKISRYKISPTWHHTSSHPPNSANNYCVAFIYRIKNEFYASKTSCYIFLIIKIQCEWEWPIFLRVDVSMYTISTHRASDLCTRKKFYFLTRFSFHVKFCGGGHELTSLSVNVITVITPYLFLRFFYLLTHSFLKTRMLLFFFV